MKNQLMKKRKWAIFVGTLFNLINNEGFIPSLIEHVIWTFTWVPKRDPLKQKPNHGGTHYSTNLFEFGYLNIKEIKKSNTYIIKITGNNV